MFYKTPLSHPYTYFVGGSFFPLSDTMSLHDVSEGYYWDMSSLSAATPLKKMIYSHTVPGNCQGISLKSLLKPGKKKWWHVLSWEGLLQVNTMKFMDSVAMSLPEALSCIAPHNALAPTFFLLSLQRCSQNTTGGDVDKPFRVELPTVPCYWHFEELWSFALIMVQFCFSKEGRKQH